MRTLIIDGLMLLFFTAVLVQGAAAQSTAFTFQGVLEDSTIGESSNYDFEFLLFDALTNGNAVAPAVSVNDVTVTNGSFSVTLDFGNQFPGAGRFLEIKVKRTSEQIFRVLSPRQAITSVPYAVKSLTSETASNATTVGGIHPGQFVLTTDPRLSDARTPLPGSAGYIQNGTGQQASSNFNISGNGIIAGNVGIGTNSPTQKLNVVGNGLFTGTLTATSFNIGADRVLIAQNLNTSVGIGSGGVAAGARNSFFGAFAGSTSASGADDNSFYGQISGTNITTGDRNSFFGSETGTQNSTGGNNTFIGYRAGLANIAGSDNTFVGSGSGENNSTISGNSGTNNTFIGRNAGNLNTTGIRNTVMGAFAFSGNQTGSNNTVVGRSAGAVNTGNDNTFFGTFAGSLTSTGVSNTFVGRNAGNTNTTGSNNTTLGFNSDVETADLSFATAIGAGAIAGFSNSIVLGRPDGSDNVRIAGGLQVETLIPSGSTPLCRNISGFLSTCLSSLSTIQKSNIKDFSAGLGVIRQLRPVSFDRKTDDQKDFGFIAEEVAEAEPRLVTYNGGGEIQGVRYELIGVVLVNAVREQQIQIDELQRKNAELQDTVGRQRAELDGLKQLICQQNKDAEVCRPAGNE